MKRTGLILIVLLLVSCISNKNTVRIKEFHPLWDTVRVLSNPGKGWYHHLLDNGISKYKIRNDSIFFSFPGMDHLYLRLAWSYLEPEEGIFNWQVIDTIIDKYVPLGYGISFRITSKETGKFPGSVNQEVAGVQYATPFWVVKAGAGGSVAERNGTKSWVPDWDDPVYLKKLDAFHKAFAERYDGKPWLRYVDIGSIGEWGEGHTSFSTKVPPSVEEVKANMDIFLKHYKKSQLVCTDDLIYYGKNEEDVKSILSYALGNGISLRDDSPLVDWYVQNYPDTWSVSHPWFYDPLYLSSPVVFELQHYGTVKKDGNWLGPDGSDTIPRFRKSGARIMRRAIETMHATYIGYHGYAEEWLADNPVLTKELANLCGYWYFPVTITYPKKLLTGLNTIEMEWINKGVAPAYNSFAIIFRFTSATDGQVFDVVVEDSGNRNWLPGKIQKERYDIELPSALKKGEYFMKFILMEINNDVKNEVKVGLKESLIDGDGFALIGKITLLLASGCRKPAETGLWQIFESSIENRKIYSNPFADVSLNVIYTRPDGSKIEFPGFYAGNSLWKIRLMPDQAGRWKYRAVFSDKSKRMRGSFMCNESDVPGMVTLYEDNPIWFGYTSGKPLLLRSFQVGDRFFADTSNFITGEVWSDIHRSRFLNWLQANRYNMISAASHYLNRNSEGRGKGWNTPDLWDENAQLPVPAEYEKMEKVLNELAARKIIVFPFSGFLGRNADYPSDPVKRELYLTYTISRLASYWNVVFNTGGPEPTLPHSPYLSREEIIQTGMAIKELNKNNHLITVHTPTGDSEFRDEPWLDFITLQGPKTTNRKELYEGLLRNHTKKKGLYAQETLWPGNKYHPAYTNSDIRKNTIVATMAAAMINFADMNGDSSSGFSGSLDTEKANDEIHKIYNNTLDFFESVDYYKMSPMNEIADNGYCLALPGKEYLVYLEEGGMVNLEVEQGEYKVTWVNASNPKEIIDGGLTTDGKGFTSPRHGVDWFLRLVK